jgi:hypothetical protein
VDAEGARALAQRILAQQALDEAAAAAEPRSAPAGRAAPAVAPAASFREPRPAAVTSPDGHVVYVRPGRRTVRGDIRMFSREIRRELVDGCDTEVTIVRCRGLVDGVWESRIVNVDSR